MSSEKILSYAAKRGAGGGPLSPVGDFVSCQPMHAFFFFFSSSKARGSSQTCSGHQYHYRWGNHRMVTRVSQLSALHGLVSMEEL